MSLQGWQETLITAQVDGAALTNTTSATSILPGAAKYTLPANYFLIGRSLRITAFGRISNIVTSPGNLTLDVRLGGVIAWNAGAVALNATAKTNVTWRMDTTLTCRSIGSSTAATLIGVGDLASESVSGSAAGIANDALLPAATPAVGTGFDSTTALQVDLFATFSTANSGNSITLHGYVLESLN